MDEEYPWYEIVDGDEDLLQGDFIRDCPVVIPPSETSAGQEVELAVNNYDVIVMSQSCDLVQRNVDLVLVSPFWSLTEFGKKNPHYGTPKGKEALRRGYLPGYHLLDRCQIDGFETDYLVVDFRAVYGVPFDFILEEARKSGRRLRLLPPYREHLSQAFARFFMRVGLPVNIPSFT